MKKTCMNCENYHGCMTDDSDSGYHFHNYCSQWNIILKADESEIFQLLGLADELGINISDLFPIWDDIESGIAECYMFTETSRSDPIDDSVFESRHQANLAIEKKLRDLLDAKIEEL